MSEVFSRHNHSVLSYLRGGQGPSLLLLHGTPGSALSWKQPATLLAAHYDVILPDLGGFGASKTLDHDLHLDHDFYMEAHAEAVHELSKDLELDSFHLGGHNFGGPVALTLLRLFPECTIESLILSATNLFTNPPVPWPLRLTNVPVIGPGVSWLLTGTRLGLRTIYWAATHNKDTFQRTDFEKHLTPSGINHTRRIIERGISDLEGNYKEIEPLLSQIDIPTLVLWGDCDPFFSVEAAKRLTNTIPQASMSLFEDTGHFVPEERPELVAWHIDDFLRAQSTPTTGPRREWSPPS